METSFSFFAELFLHSLSLWWVIIPSIFLGLIVGAIPGFSAANTIIILLPFTLVMDVEVGLVFMVALYCASRMGAGIPAILVNIPGTAGAAATPLDGYPMAKQGRAGDALLPARDHLTGARGLGSAQRYYQVICSAPLNGAPLNWHYIV